MQEAMCCSAASKGQADRLYLHIPPQLQSVCFAAEGGGWCGVGLGGVGGSGCGGGGGGGGRVFPSFCLSLSLSLTHTHTP